MLYKSLKDTELKINPTCFGSQRIHHQGVMTCTLLQQYKGTNVVSSVTITP